MEPGSSRGFFKRYRRDRGDSGTLPTAICGSPGGSDRRGLAQGVAVIVGAERDATAHEGCCRKAPQVSDDLRVQKQRRSCLLDNAAKLAGIDYAVAPFERQSRERQRKIGSIDDHSRYALSVDARANEQMPHGAASTNKVIRRYGLPGAFFGDNSSLWGESLVLALDLAARLVAPVRR
jgi:hypothetical protein